MKPGGTPSYDIRVKSIADPVELVYKAAIYQNTMEDWQNVRIHLSSSNPKLEGTIPQLEPYRLDFSVPIVMRYSTYKALEGSVAGEIDKKNNSDESQASYIPKQVVENTTSFSFDILENYTIKSNGKQTVVEIDSYSLPATYIYTCIPKLDKDVFLSANIVGWEKYNLLNGETTIYFENTYVGKSTLDLGNMSDTLILSLGRDKSIVVNREKIKEFSTKQFIGNKKTDTRVWHISIKNNKIQPVQLLLVDQVPVSSNADIEVSTENISGGFLNAESGQIKWNLTLDPASKKDFELKYTVKYPSNKALIIN